MSFITSSTVSFGTTQVINPHQCPVVKEFHMHGVVSFMRNELGKRLIVYRTNKLIPFEILTPTPRLRSVILLTCTRIIIIITIYKNKVIPRTRINLCAAFKSTN